MDNTTAITSSEALRTYDQFLGDLLGPSFTTWDTFEKGLRDVAKNTDDPVVRERIAEVIAEVSESSFADGDKRMLAVESRLTNKLLDLRGMFTS